MPSKKRRISESQDTPKPVKRNLNSADFKHELFTQWSKDRGVQIHAVKPQNIPNRGVGLVTTAPIKKDERILFVPEKAMFKPTVAKMGKRRFDAITERGSPQALLTMCLGAELSDPSSPMHKWKATWPAPEDLLPSLPVYWDDKEALELLPKSTWSILRRQRNDWETDGRMWCIDAFEKSETKIDIPEKEFDYYWAIVNSRSFHFKPAGSRPGYMVLCPFIDYMNHGTTGTGVVVKQTPKGYEVTADRDYDEGEEILVTYGAHDNDKLLVHYGFVIPTTPGESSDDCITLDHLLLLALGGVTTDNLRNVGFLGGYALIPATNEVCFKTQVAVRAEILTANEWEYFIANGEDLSGDHNGRVREFLVEKVMMPYYKEATQRVAELNKIEDSRSGEEEPVALDLARQRWAQIADGLIYYLGPDFLIAE